MEKPLHERLRKIGDNGRYFGCYLCKLFNNGNCPPGRCANNISKAINIMADEIERDYVTKEKHEAEIARIVEAQENGVHNVIKAWAEHNGMPMRKDETITEWIDRWTVMRPRFDDGDPVPGNHEDDRVSYYYVYDDGSWVLRPVGEDGSDLEEINGHADEHVKLTVHKVYDADGAEIKVGDTVWFANSGTERTVKSLRQHDDGGYEIEFTNGLYCTSPYQLTHERPVFDADGERIRNGDTVWYIKTGRELKVLSPHGYGECTYDCVDCFGFYPKPSELTHERPVFDAEGVRIRKGDEGWSDLSGKKLAPVVGFTEDKFGMKVDLEDGYWIESINFTHREPDSLEKLRYDILREDRTRGMSCVHVWADRITALMERGA